MKFKTIIVLILFALIVVVLIQNSLVIPVNILLWNMTAPVFLLCFFMLCLGFLAGVLAATMGRRHERKTPPPDKS
jgi:uncharacterized integral membrane protein